MESKTEQMSPSANKNDLPASQGESTDKGPGKKKKSLLIYGIAGLVFIGGSVGAAAKFGLINVPGISQSKTPKTPPPEPLEAGAILKLSPLIINLKEEDGRHYLKTTIIFEMSKKEGMEEVQAKVPHLTDMVILTLGEKNMEFLKQPQSKEKLKEELLAKINQELDIKKIKQIYFDEFLYQ
jgi:flagellar basal body-associated protein FliL